MQMQFFARLNRSNFISTAQELAAEAEYLVLWLDCDLEGENIGFEVISLCQEWVLYDNVYRAKFSALTVQELTTAYQNLARPDKHAAMSVDARQEMDLKIGVSVWWGLVMVITYARTPQ